ncbi:Uncharacterised protein [uncultured Comamonas sp.]|nr:Uncharacterised protein [uncultured Comamonas sp.]
MHNAFTPALHHAGTDYEGVAPWKPSLHFWPWNLPPWPCCTAGMYAVLIYKEELLPLLFQGLQDLINLISMNNKR